MRPRQRGFSLIELLITVAIILIIAAIAIPNLLRSRVSAHEASAVSALRSINTACTSYYTTYGAFPAALTNLQAPSSGNPSSTAADLIDQGLASGTKSGYTFTYTQGAGGLTFSVLAAPVTMNQTGVREFYMDATGVIRSNVGAAADASSTPLR